MALAPHSLSSFVVYIFHDAHCYPTYVYFFVYFLYPTYWNITVPRMGSLFYSFLQSQPKIFIEEIKDGEKKEEKEVNRLVKILSILSISMEGRTFISTPVILSTAFLILKIIFMQCVQGYLVSNLACQLLVTPS